MLRGLLTPAECLYRGGLRLRKALYRGGVFTSRRLPAPVISIGNLSVGGSGKTPLTIAVARRFLKEGRRPAVLTRGYRGSERGVAVVSNGREVLMDPGRAGDEAVVLAEQLDGVPVVRGVDRYAAGLLARREFDADLLLLDDGFQHWELARDVDVLLVDGDDPVEGGHCLPAGRLREPPIASRRAHVIVAVGGTRTPSDVRRALDLDPEVPVFQALPRAIGYSRGNATEMNPVHELRGKKVAAFCGIARPERFRRMLDALGADVVGWKTYRDHISYSAREKRRLSEWARRIGAEEIVTTSKDFVKLAAGDVSVLHISLEAEGGFYRFLSGRIRQMEVNGSHA